MTHMTKTTTPLEQTKVTMSYLYRQEWREKAVGLGTVCEWTREGKYRHRVDAVRELDDIAAEGGLVSGPPAAEELPRVMPAAGADGGYTGLVLLSFRVGDGSERLEQLRQTVNRWEQTLLSFVGSSGMSLKVIMAYRLRGGALPKDTAQTTLFRQYAYKRAADFALASTGVKPEETAPDGTEHFCISYDPAAYLNPAAMAIEMEQPTEPLTEASAQFIPKPQEVTLDTQLLPGYTRRDMDATKYNYVCRQLAYGKQLEPADYLMQLATGCRLAGIDKELAIKLTAATADFRQKDVLVRSTFNNAYEGHRMGTTNPIEKSLMHQQLLEEFLRRRYMFRRNRVTGDIEYQEKYRYMLSWKPLTEEARNDINNAAIREGIKVWTKDLERILLSEHTESYDPVREWLDKLPAWDGRDRLGELADRVPTHTPGWHDNFKIWMRSMVSQWRSGCNANYGAQMVLMLVGSQGTRKSTFMRMLLPEELKPFYIDRIDFTNKKEALRALSRFLLINIDEYDQVSKSQTAFLKHLIQRTDVKERKLYSTMFEQSQRYAAFCATTNSLVPLKDESGSRRYLVAEVAGPINTDRQGEQAIDYQQLYAQIVTEIERGEEYAFTGERERSIVEHNSNFYEQPNVVALFEDLFRKPQGGDATLTMSPTEILNYIHKQLKVNVVNQANATTLGSYLHRKGYQKGKGESRRCYLLALRG